MKTLLLLKRTEHSLLIYFGLSQPEGPINHIWLFNVVVPFSSIRLQQFWNRVTFKLVRWVESWEFLRVGRSAAAALESCIWSYYWIIGNARYLLFVSPLANHFCWLPSRMECRRYRGSKRFSRKGPSASDNEHIWEQSNCTRRKIRED